MDRKDEELTPEMMIVGALLGILLVGTIVRLL
jgi:hypothetical protein